MMGVNSLPKTVTRQRHGCDLNPGPSAPESSTLTTRTQTQLECDSASASAETRHVNNPQSWLLCEQDIVHIASSPNSSIEQIATL